MPDFKLLGGSRVNQQLRTGRGLLLDFGADRSLRALAARWSEQIDYVVGDSTERLDVSAALVRPDGVVAWACEGEAHLGDVEHVATRWFGKPCR